MHSFHIPMWKTSPFCRLIIPLMGGIVLHKYLPLSLFTIVLSGSCLLLAFLLYYLLPLALQYRLQFLQGWLLLMILLSFGMFITWNKDIRHRQNWYGHSYHDSNAVVIGISEPLTGKPKSFKTTGAITAIIQGSATVPVQGKLYLYFSKDTASAGLQYGDQVLVNKPLQGIKNSGNPGAFNYQRYASFQQVFHTIYLKEGEWRLLKQKDINRVHAFIFHLRHKTISILRKYIPGDKNVMGIAEALLVGYKEDLDKDLVQAYSNAGVVHIIAISGLHLGLIYMVLVWLFNRLWFVKNNKFTRVVLILACLWLFSLITGASASVLRSAVMFTCIVIGKNYLKQSSIHNSLAASAFILLCYDPYFLWDVGFQLSYLAIIGIVALQVPIGKIAYFKAGWLNKLWNMLAVTIAAQVATFPVCIYYFHQFPNLFFITNLIAVPLSTIILFAEIFLLVISPLGSVAMYTGKLIYWLVWLMNSIIETCNSFPFSLLDNIYSDLLTTGALYLFVMGICAWLLNKNKASFKLAVLSLACFTAFHAYAKLQCIQQQKLVIYSIPAHQAMDFIFRNEHIFYGDSIVDTDAALGNFHLKPARAALQATNANKSLPGLKKTAYGWEFLEKRLVIIDSSLSFVPIEDKISIDILLISKNPAVKIAGLVSALKPSIVVFDASNSLWKIAGWKKECERLALPYFSIPQEGAFILDIE